MSNDTAKLARLFSLEAMVKKMILDGARLPDEMIEVLQKVVDERSFFPLSVNYDEPIITLIDRGKYDHCDPRIAQIDFLQTRSTPYQGVSPCIGQLVDLGQSITPGDASFELNSMGLRPGGLHELLAFGIIFPEAQKKLRIIALNHLGRSGDDFFSPILSGWDHGRSLDLSSHARQVGGKTRFLAFPISRN